MRQRDEILKKLKAEVYAQMATVSKNPKYPDLIRNLITEVGVLWLACGCVVDVFQGLLTIMELEVEVLCRQEDEKIVKAQLQPAIEEYKRILTRVRPVT